MCAILTWAGKPTAQILRDMYRNAAQWGPHSVGLSYYAGNHLKVFKRAITPEVFLHNCYRRLDTAAESQLGMGHVRWATHGHVVDRNAHPFFHDGIVFVHNGVIGNYHEFGNYEVDSQCLGPMIRKQDTSPAFGSVGLAWFDMNDKQLYVYRRGQSLRAFTFTTLNGPLTLVVSRGGVVNSNGLRLPVRETTLEEGTAYRVDPEGLTQVWSDRKPTVWGDRGDRLYRRLMDEDADTEYKGG